VAFFALLLVAALNQPLLVNKPIQFQALIPGRLLLAYFQFPLWL
jgi:hypothetical protein